MRDAVCSPNSSNAPHRKRCIEVWCRVKQPPNKAGHALQAILRQEGVVTKVRFFSSESAEVYGLHREGAQGTVSWQWEHCSSDVTDATLWGQLLEQVPDDCCVAWATDCDAPTPYRLAQCLKALEVGEILHGCKTPLLVHSDAWLCSEDGIIMQRSWWAHQRAELPPRDQLGWLVEPGILLATMLINRPLANLLRICPAEVSWEHWVGAMASSSGRVISLREPLLFWREQTNRVPAGRPLGERLFLGLAFSWREGVDRWILAARIASCLRVREANCLQAENLKTLSQWAQLSRLERISALSRWGFWFQRGIWGRVQLIWSLVVRREPWPSRSSIGQQPGVLNG